MPDFELPDQAGRPSRLADALADRPLGLWSEKEELARSALVPLPPGGKELLRCEGRDYADRPDTAAHR